LLCYCDTLRAATPRDGQMHACTHAACLHELPERANATQRPNVARSRPPLDNSYSGQAGQGTGPKHAKCQPASQQTGRFRTGRTKSGTKEQPQRQQPAAAAAAVALPRALTLDGTVAEGFRQLLATSAATKAGVIACQLATF